MAHGRRGSTTLRRRDIGRAEAARAVGGRPRLLLVDEHAVAAHGLRLALKGCGYDVETTSGPTCADVVEVAERFRPDIVLTDIDFRNRIASGIDLIVPLTARGSAVVMLTSERRRLALAECLEAGAVGWIRKDTDLGGLEDALERVLDGRPIVGATDRADLLALLRETRHLDMSVRRPIDLLTQREAHVLAAMVDGLTAEEIANEHVVSLATVRSQIRGVLQKLEVRSQLAAVSVAAPHRHLLPSRNGTVRERRRSGGAADAPTGR